MRRKKTVKRKQRSAAPDAGHATHFLERLDERAEGEAEDFALALYHDPVSLRAALATLGVPEAAPRVALSLAPGDEGAWAIVTREGSFVTCLAAGMDIGPAYRVAHARLRAHRDRFERDKARVLRALSLADDPRPLAALCRRIFEGPLAREEHQALEVLAPLLSDQLDAWFLRELEGLSRLLQRGVNRPAKRRDPRLLRKLYVHYSSCGNLLLLLGDHYTARLAGRLDAPLSISALAPLAMPRELGMSLRLCWFLGYHGKVCLPACKQTLQLGLDLSTLVIGHLGVVAIAARQRKCRAEVAKQIERLAALFSGWSLPLQLPDVGAMYSKRAWPEYERTLAAPERMAEIADQMLESWYLDVAKGFDERPFVPPATPDPSLAFALRCWPATVFAEPLNKADREFYWALLHALIARAARAEAGDFCVPFANLSAPGTRINDEAAVAGGRRLVEAATPCIRDIAAREQGPALDHRVGRNAPCPCGSGDKYKRCCLPKLPRSVDRMRAQLEAGSAELRERARGRRELLRSDKGQE